MPSSYTPSLRLVLPVTGELQGAWGDTVNNGLTSLVDASIAGTADIAMTDANRTLSVNNELPDEARCMFINLTGTLTASRDVICPAVSKLYFVHNATNQVVVFKTLLGTGVSIPVGSRIALYCNATNVVPAVDDLPAASKVAGIEIVTVSGTQTLTNKTLTSPTISGGTLNNISIGATTASTGAFTDLAYTGTLTGGTGVINIGSGQLYKDASGNVGIGTSAPGTRLAVVTNVGTAYSSTALNTSILALSNSSSGTGRFTGINFEGIAGDSNSSQFAIGTVSPATGVPPAFVFQQRTGTGTTNWAERMRITSAGNVGIGTSAPATKLQVVDGDIAVTTSGSFSKFNATRAVAPSSAGIQLGRFDFSAYSTGTTYVAGASIQSFSDAAWSSTSAPGYLSFETTASGSTSLTERMRIDSAGRVLVGATASRGDNSPLQVTNDAGNGMEMFRGQANAFGTGVLLSKSRGTTISPAIVVSQDQLGVVAFKGYDGAAYRDGALVIGASDGTPGAGSMPGRLVFSTTPTGSTTPEERMRIISAGNVLMGTSSTGGPGVFNDTPHTLSVQNTAQATPQFSLKGGQSLTGNGTAQVTHWVKRISAAGNRNRIVIPFINQGSLNQTTMIRVMAHVQRFNSRDVAGLSFHAIFAVGHLDQFGTLVGMGSGGNLSSITTSFPDVRLNLSTALNTGDEIALYLEVMSLQSERSVDYANIRVE